MEIEFYEEFPNKNNLSKLKLIKFPTKIFLGAKSLEEFRKFEKIAKSYKNNLKVAYWPVVKNSYWISAFSNPKDLVELFDILSKIENDVLIDLELPLKKYWKLYLKNIFNLSNNKKLIKSFLEKNKSRITTAEYIRSPLQKRTKFIGLDFDVKTQKSLMFYSSCCSKSDAKKWKKMILDLEDKENYSISLGTLAGGIMGNEKILSPENLRNDLKFVQESGFKKAIIFRLEGINKDYVKILEKYRK